MDFSGITGVRLAIIGVKNALEARGNAPASGAAAPAPEDDDCRATLCRVEVQHRDEAKLQEFQRLFPFKVSQVLPRLMMHRIENADGSITTYLYLARQGYPLSTAESGN